jgi:hypothetical protein
MNDRELFAMAVFSISEAAKRIEVLAKHVESPTLSLWLETVARELGDQAKRANTIVTDADARDGMKRRATRSQAA